MKSKYKYSLLLLVSLLVSAVLLRCTKNDEMGTPSISYIRITDPAASDSLLISANQGQMIVIMGQNLGSVTQAWFNDQPATLIPTFITNTTIITKVPTQIPIVITDKMKLVFANGSSLDYDFSVDISKPQIDHVRSEYVNAGDSLVIYGNYFYKPLVVSFAGGAQAEILSVSADSKILIAKMPTGVQPGPLTVTSNFGAKVSDFWMQDNRNFIASFDVPLTNVWKGPGYTVSSDPDISAINAKFFRVNLGQLGAYPFLEVYGGPKESDIAIETKNIPQDAIANAAGYSLKFEVNTLVSLTGAYMRVYIGDADNGNLDAKRQSIYYTWQPNLNTHGAWQTVTIPWADVYNANKSFAYSSSGYAMFIYWHGPNKATYNYAMDNIRVVPNK
jgi:hypothetical protein